MNGIRTWYRCNVETITPLHIGSGETLIKDFDFFVDNKRLLLVNRDRMFARIKELGDVKIMEFTAAIEDGNPAEWLKKNGVPLASIASRTAPIPKNNPPKDIHCQIRDAFGRPLLPGSSLKGAFRTAILRKIAKNEQFNVLQNIKPDKPEHADQWVANKLLGQDPKESLMRTLSVGDAVLPESATTVLPVEIMRQVPGNKFAEKHFFITVEAIPATTQASGVVSFDEFLPDQDKKEKCFNFKQRLSLGWLREACLELTTHTIETELTFLNGKKGIDGLPQFYKGLQKQLEDLKDNEIIIQTAWGAGWRGMTGQLLEQNDLTRERRKQLRLASQEKYLNFPFPKSRRLANENGRNLPMGWVKLTFTTKEKVKQQEEIVRLQKLDSLRQQEEKQKEEEEKARREAELALIREEERLVIMVKEATANQAGEQMVNTECYPKLNSLTGGDQKNLALALKEFYSRLGKWGKKKEVSKGQFIKVQKIKGILGES